MKKTFFAFAMLCSQTAHADTLQLSRESSDVYVSPDGSTLVETRGCTQTALQMDAVIVDGYRDGRRRFVEFRAPDGSYENECEVKTVVRLPKMRVAKKHKRSRVAAR